MKYQIKPKIPIKNLFLDIFIHKKNDELRMYLQEFINSEY